MRIKLISFIITFLLLNCDVNSQADTIQMTQHTFYVEAAGIGGYGSINYERLLHNRSNLSLLARLGLSTLNLRDFEIKFNPDIIIPLGINLLYGNNHKLELGIGQVVSNTVVADPSTWEPSRETDIHANFTIGYRYQKIEGGFMYRVSYTPIIESYELYRHWGGLSFGYSF